MTHKLTLSGRWRYASKMRLTKTIEFNSELLKDIKRRLELHFPKKKCRLILYGSRARGDHSERSDYDLAFDIEEISTSDWAAFALEVREESPTLHGLDLIWLQQCSCTLASRIKTEGKILYESKGKG